MKKILILILVFACAIVAFPLAAQVKQSAQTVSSTVSDKPRLAVFGFLNLTEDDAFSIPAETASNSLFITMRMLNLFQVTDQDTVPRSLTDTGLAQWCARNNIDFVIFGTVKLREDGGQDYRLAYFSSAAKRITASKKESGENVLDVFSVVDTLTESMLGTIVDNKISFGSLAFENSGIEGDYDVYLDGSFIQTNPPKFDRVPVGEHTVRVVQKATGVELVTTTRTVAAKKQETVTFALKVPTKAELAAAPEAVLAIGQKITDEQIAENIGAINVAIGNGLDKNFIDISDRARILPDSEKEIIFNLYRKTNVKPFVLNLVASPLFPLGSAIQKDIFGTVFSTTLKVTGLAAATWFMVNYRGEDPGYVGVVFVAGIGSFLVGNIYSYVRPFTFASEYNSTLEDALGIRRGVKITPTVGIAPAGETVGLRMGISVAMQ